MELELSNIIMLSIIISVGVSFILYLCYTAVTNKESLDLAILHRELKHLVDEIREECVYVSSTTNSSKIRKQLNKIFTKQNKIAIDDVPSKSSHALIESAYMKKIHELKILKRRLQHITRKAYKKGKR